MLDKIDNGGLDWFKQHTAYSKQDCLGEVGSTLSKTPEEKYIILKQKKI